jgi:hypothetical protein
MTIDMKTAAALWPAPGQRAAAYMCIIGGLLRARWPVERVEELVSALAEATGDEQAPDRLKLVQTAKDRLEADEKVAGWPSLAGILGGEAALRLRLAVDAALDVETLAAAKQLPADFLRGLGVEDAPDYAGHVVIIYSDMHGKEITTRKRYSLESKPIWKKGTKAVAYGVDRLAEAAQAGYLHLVEGESDCWTLWHHGEPALGIPGAECARVLQADHVGAFSKLFVVQESDGAGETFVQRVNERLAELGWEGELRVIPMSAKRKDPSALHCVNPDKFKERWAKRIAAAEKVEPMPLKNAGEKKPSKGEGLPQIIIDTDEHRVNAQAAQALAADTDLYQRGGLLARVVRDSAPAALLLDEPALRIADLPPPQLRSRLTAVAEFVVENDKGETRPVHPPGWVVSAVNTLGQWPGVRHLQGVVEFPVLRPDGTVLSTPGYDASTGLIYEPNCAIPVIPEAPTRDDAVKACKRLLGVVQDFPFATPAHQSAYLCALLTPAARFAFRGNAPLFLANANVRGVGKGLLFNVLARILTGQDMATATYTNDTDELRKHITAVALAGYRMVLFDNLVGRFGNSVLDAALTTTRWEGRVLGASQIFRGPLFVTWFATGNNVSLQHDMPRRVCAIRLQSDLEAPHTRSDFRHPDLLAHVDARRPKLLTCVLTILRGYCVAGRPDMNLPAWGSFGGWSDLVRSAVVWCGLPDPIEAAEELQDEADPVAGAMGILLKNWHRLRDKKGRGLTATEVIRQLYPEAGVVTEAWMLDTRDAVEELCGSGDTRDLPRLLGYKLRDFRRRNLGGWQIDRGTQERGSNRWVCSMVDMKPMDDIPRQTGRPKTETSSSNNGTPDRSGPRVTV